MQRAFYCVCLLAFSAGLSSCSLFQRHPGSGYAGTRHSGVVPMMTAQRIHNYKKAAHQLGLSYEQAMTNSEVFSAVQTRAEIIDREAALSGSKEKQQFYYYRPWLTSDEEVLEFLRQPNFQARQNWIHSQEIDQRYHQPRAGIQNLIEAEDIALGMQMELVRKSWGEPTRKDVSGDPLYRNQRWTYSKYTPSPEGYQLQRRTVYFENGRVAGWSLD